MSNGPAAELDLANIEAAEHGHDPDHFWVFGYGSLMWNPGFEHVEAVPARMGGVHRSPCIYSWVHRGTQQRPGIVLGLDEGGMCSGLAFRVRESDRDAVVSYLRERELVTNVYVESIRHAQLHTGGTVACLTYVVDRYHEQYAGRLELHELVDIISGATGKSGRNEDYFFDTARQLDAMGIEDDTMDAIAKALLAKAKRPVTAP